MQTKIQRTWLLWLVLFLFFLTAQTQTVVAARTAPHSFPRTANYYLSWELNETMARELARWQLVVLDMEIQYRASELIKKMRQLNPNIVILVYITPEEIRQDAPGGYSVMRRRLAAGIPESWYMHNAAGARLTWWPGTYILNVTPNAPVINGQRFSDYMAHFVDRELLSTGLWDGVFYDNAWDNITYFAGRDIDSDNDGMVDADPDAAWRAGMRAIYRTTRQLAPNAILVGNGTTRAYQNELDGMMLENFVPGAAWKNTMNTYRSNQAAGQFNVVNANTNNGGGDTNYQDMRFGFASTLMENGYYSYDSGDQNHGQTWRYDEYNLDLGEPVSESYPPVGGQKYEPTVWRRDFSRGIAIVNSTPEIQAIDLGGEFEKIHGTQDRLVNNGAIVSETTLAGYDGALLLKTVTTLPDVWFTNGGFVRFFRPGGARVRNGFFIYEEGYRGGEQIIHTDANGDGSRDVFVVAGNQLLGWRADGQPLVNVYPYGAGYSGTLRVTIVDVNGDGAMEYVVAPSAGAQPIKIYDIDGNAVGDEWYPFGKKFTRGVSLAVAPTGPLGEIRFIVSASGVGEAPRVFIFDTQFKKVREWLAFEKKYRGGVSVAAGDVNGDGVAEIVVGAGLGKPPVVRTFSEAGKAIAPEFTAYKTVRRTGADVRVADVDFDGQQDIVVISQDAGI